MFGFKNNYLYRSDFINLVDSDKIWSKTMSISEIKELLNILEEEISKHDYEKDNNYLMNSRRVGLRKAIEENLLIKDRDTDRYLLESLFNFWEFVNDEYSGNFLNLPEELGLSIQELSNMDIEYRKKGIISIEEKDDILKMIEILNNYINEVY